MSPERRTLPHQGSGLRCPGRHFRAALPAPLPSGPRDRGSLLLQGACVAGRVKLGSWTCPSGNSLDVYLEPDVGDGLRHATLEWDSPPPLDDADLIHYLGVVLPALSQRAQEYLGAPGRLL